MSLSKEKIYLLRKFVYFICESCQKTESEVGTLEPHRIFRGNNGGEYKLRNILMVCNKCHKRFHSNELGLLGR